MCGICGVLDFKNKISEPLVREMTDSISYRGPDNEGFYFSDNIGLGHRRLSIIDTSEAGNQPLYNEDRSIVLVFNGEIYNYRSWKRILQNRGHEFSSDTDSEVILHLYEDYGYDCLGTLNGMFSFALWDSNKQKLFVARDRLGIKPLHYYYDSNKFVFGSEIKSILKDKTIEKSINQESLSEYLSYNYISAPSTIYNKIYKLEPATLMVIGKNQFYTKKYWDASKVWLPYDYDVEAQKETLSNWLEVSVSNRMISDVPIGSFLSGGLDSSIITGLMARNSNSPIKTFSIGYKDNELYDEIVYAREVARFNNTDHHEFKLGAEDVLDAVPEVLSLMDEPFADSSIIPSYLVSKEASKEVKVILSGDGACLLYTSPSPRDRQKSRMPSSA